jgi:hypothetical protein
MYAATFLTRRWPIWRASPVLCGAAISQSQQRDAGQGPEQTTFCLSWSPQARSTSVANDHCRALTWVVRSKQPDYAAPSHADERQEHDEVIKRHQCEVKRL